MKYLIFLCLSVFTFGLGYAQDNNSKISLSGFRVNLIPAESFRIQMDDSIEIKKEMEGNILKIGVIDQTGRVPKGNITIYINKLEYLYLHNCQLVMETPIICDSLVLLTASSFGALKINSNYLSTNIGGGSRFEIEGKTQYYDCGVGAGSTLQSAKLVADKAFVDAMGYSNLILNAKEIVESKVKNASVKNTYE